MEHRFRTRSINKVGPSTRLPPSAPEDASLERARPGHNPGRGAAPGSPAQDAENAQGRMQGRMMEVEGVYIISVAARILDMHPQTLRKYERLGLITPVRTVGMLRLYSREDIRKLLLIRHLVDHLGLNLAGVELTLNLVENMLNMGRRLEASAVGTPLEGKIQQEMARLFRALDLPVEE